MAVVELADCFYFEVALRFWRKAADIPVLGGCLQLCWAAIAEGGWVICLIRRDQSLRRLLVSVDEVGLRLSRKAVGDRALLSRWASKFASRMVLVLTPFSLLPVLVVPPVET